MAANRARERGHIDNRPVVIIFLIIGTIGAYQYLKLTGIEPADLWARVPLVWRSLFWATVGFVFFGSLLTAVTVIADERREPFRVESHGDRRVILETARALRVACALLVLFGLTLAGFGMAGGGWFAWLVLVLGIVIGLAGAITFGVRKRFVVERGRVVLDPHRAPPATGTADPAPRQAISVRSSRSGGAFGRPLVERNVVWVDDREILDAPYLEKADKLAAALKQAIEETSARRSA